MSRALSLTPQRSMSSPPGWVTDQQYGFFTAGLIAVSLFMLQVPDALDWSNVGVVQFELSGSTAFIARWQWMPFFAAALLLAVMRLRLTTSLLPHLNPFLILLVLWIFCSSAWSPDPGLTSRRAIKVTGVLLIALAFTLASWHPQRFEQVVRNTLLVFIVLSLFMVVLLPQYGVHQASGSEPLLAGSWRGLSAHKNGLGPMAGIGLVLWTHAWLTGVNRKLVVAAMLLCLITLVGARSSTALACSMFSAMVLVLARSSPLMRRPLSLLLGMATLVLVPVSVYIVIYGIPTLNELLAPVTAGLGRDITFTGRTELWEGLLKEIPRHPWIGIGYQAFWQGPGSPSDFIAQAGGWRAYNGHNGYLDVLNELGLIGLGLLLAAIVLDLRRCWALADWSASFFALHLTLQVYQLISNFAETSFLRTISLTFLLTTLSSFHVSRVMLDQALRQRAGGRKARQLVPAIYSPDHAHRPP